MSHVCVTVRALASLCVRACMCLWGVELVTMCVCDYHLLLNLFHAEKA